MTAFPVVLTAAEMRAADEAAVRDLGTPSLLLMENAGRGVADIVRREPGGAGAGAEVVVVCGGGANGGDGLVCARHLAGAGVRTRVLLASSRKFEGDAAVMLTVLASLANAGGVPIEDASGWQEEARWRAGLAGATLIVDALFGTGGRGVVSGVPAVAIAAMNATTARKVAVDLPSGLDADTGQAPGIVFRADVTVTMGAHKLGLVLDAAAPVGRIEIAALGVPIAAGRGRCWLLDEPGVVALVPRREATDHKGSSGHLVIVAGSPGKTGAAALVGRAALRAGAGLATIASTQAGQAALDAKVLELMTARFSDAEEPDPAPAVAALSALGQRAQAFAIGPGIPTGAGMRAVVRELAARLPLPMVLDADALNALATDAPAALVGAPAGRVLTPHPGEMGRLLGIATAEVQSDRLGHARRLAAATGAVVVLKGARTIIAAPDGGAFISPFACAALATAGSGDVLSGVIGALLARGLAPLAAAQVGVYVHGAAGVAAAARTGDGTLAGDLPLAVAKTMRRLTA
jgi:NAD(P)H-hydrate epimerase